MVDFIRKAHYSYDDLCQVVSILRSDNGCPWDRVQTHASIRRNLLEEAYEACEGIDLDDPKLMQEEFGDVLLQVVFHTDIEKDRGRFTMEDVIDTVCKKLIFRHPHVFADTAAEQSDFFKRRNLDFGKSEAVSDVAYLLFYIIPREHVGTHYVHRTAGLDNLFHVVLQILRA